MKKALLLSILCLFLCTSFAFATSEPVTGGDIELSGTVATVKDGFLPATLTVRITDQVYNENNQISFFTGFVTVKVGEDDAISYEKTFTCTGYMSQTPYPYGYMNITTTDKAIFSTHYDPGSSPTIIMQIPGDGMTGKFISN